MIKLLELLLSEISQGIFDVFDIFVSNILKDTLAIEVFLSTALSQDAVQNLYRFMYIFACSLIALKFLQRGFSIYVLWRDGDPDSSPKEMITGLIMGIFSMLSFPFLYDMLCEVVIWLYQNIGTYLALSETAALKHALTTVGVGILPIVVSIIYAIIGFILWLQLIKRGLELLVLRLGFPIACIGFINSDGGMFRGYLNTIIKTVLTLMTQAVLMSVSFKLVLSVDLKGMLLGIAALLSAYSIPTLFQSVLISGHGPNVSGKVVTTTRVIQGLKGFMK